jgi:hypothetical protein
MSVKIDQALISAFIDASFGLPIAHENGTYDPQPGTDYAELLVLQNNITPLNLSSSNETDGIFRVILRYPAGELAITSKTMADTIFANFGIGQRLSYSGVKVTIMSNQRGPGVNEDSWYKMVLTMSYRAFLAR